MYFSSFLNSVMFYPIFTLNTRKFSWLVVLCLYSPNNLFKFNPMTYDMICTLTTSNHVYIKITSWMRCGLGCCVTTVLSFHHITMTINRLLLLHIWPIMLMYGPCSINLQNAFWICFSLLLDFNFSLSILGVGCMTPLTRTTCYIYC